MLDDQSATPAMREVLEILREQAAWLRALAMPSLRATVQKAFESEGERRAFEASDGTRTGREIADLVGASPASVSRWWKKWRSLGIATEVAPRRTSHLVSLSDLGLALRPQSSPTSQDPDEGPLRHDA